MGGNCREQGQEIEPNSIPKTRAADQPMFKLSKLGILRLVA